MPTKTKPKAKSKAKVKPKIQWERLEAMLPSRFGDVDIYDPDALDAYNYYDDYLASVLSRMKCCGIMEFSGLNNVKSKLHALAIRVAASMIGNSGYVLASTAAAQNRSKIPTYLNQAGFKQLTKFINPRTKSGIVLWGAPALKMSEVEIEELPPKDDGDGGEEVGFER